MQLDQLKRRKFITLLGGAVAWPVSARAQRPAHIPRIGIIDDAPMWQAFRHALRELGYVEGQNIAYEYRYGEGAPDRLMAGAAELVRPPGDLISTYRPLATHAGQEAAGTIPPLLSRCRDPV